MPSRHTVGGLTWRGTGLGALLCKPAKIHTYLK